VHVLFYHNFIDLLQDVSRFRALVVVATGPGRGEKHVSWSAVCGLERLWPKHL